MAPREVGTLEGAIEGLATAQQVALYERLEGWRHRMDWLTRDLEEALEEVRDRRFPEGVHCPDCGSGEVWRWGRRNGKQRYRCKECERCFNDFTGTPFAHSRKPWEQWAQYVECMLDGKTIRECAEEVGISVPTSFRWRHAVLRALRQLDEAGELEGLVEVDEAYFRHSRKGERDLPRKPRKRGEPAKKRGKSKHQACVFTAQDRTGGRYARVVGRGAPKRRDLRSALEPRLGETATGLCSDGESSYAALCSTWDLAHHLCDSKGKDARPGGYHLQHVNNFHSLLKRWLRPFNGVATKYLDHYTSWFTFDREATEAMSRSGAWQELLVRTSLADP